MLSKTTSHGALLSCTIWQYISKEKILQMAQLVLNQFLKQSQINRCESLKDAYIPLIDCYHYLQFGNELL